MTTPDVLVIGTLCAGAGTGAAIDIASRRIPNGVTLSTAAAGLGLAATGFGHVTVPAALLGMVLGLVLLMPGHVFGATGAGDVKLFAAAGTLLGPGRTVEAFLWTAIAGGVLALGIACWRGRLAHTIGRMLRVGRPPLEDTPDTDRPAGDNTFPYGPAIAAGCLVALLR
jgi:prepilin peptidase CpaA